jgi:hypothetical protein
VPYYYPTFERTLGFGDYIVFWAIPTWEQPGLPAGLRAEAPTPGTAAPATPPATPPAK